MTPFAASQRGFTLIELMVVVVIVAVGASLAMPSFQSWIGNSRVRTATDSVVAGLDEARMLAIKHNARVEFVIAASGAEWQVIDRGGAVTGTPGQVIRAEGGIAALQAVEVTRSPQDSRTVSFAPFGNVTSLNQSKTEARLRQLDFEMPAVPGVRPLRVQIESGGAVRSCEPAAVREGQKCR